LGFSEVPVFLCHSVHCPSAVTSSYYLPGTVAYTPVPVEVSLVPELDLPVADTLVIIVNSVAAI